MEKLPKKDSLCELFKDESLPISKRLKKTLIFARNETVRNPLWLVKNMKQSREKPSHNCLKVIDNIELDTKN